MSWKRLFSKALAAAPRRLHFAAHSHHLWPDASLAGHEAAWLDAALLADLKWDRVMGPVWSEAQAHVARILNLPDPGTVAFSANTHDFLVRLLSAIPKHPVRVLSTDGEFHSFTRQMARWVENGDVVLTAVPAAALHEAARDGQFDLIFASQVLFNSGTVLGELERLAELAHPEGPWVVIDGYHGFMAIPTDLARIADRVFYLAGGYKYAMAGEGVCFLHAPPGYAPRPVLTGWYAAFSALSRPGGGVDYPLGGERFLGSTFDPSGLYRFNAVQRMLLDEGLAVPSISAHVAQLQERFVNICPMGGLQLLNPLTSAPHARFLAYRGAQAARLHEALLGQDILTDLRGDVLRIGFALYHDEGDVDRLTEALNALPVSAQTT